MYLGIDLGTSSVKIVLIDEAQNIVGTSSASLSVSRPQPLWSEQNPQDWWLATQRAIKTLKNTHTASFKKINAIALSGQMHGATLLNKKHQPLRPAILWNDGRSFSQCQKILNRVPDAPQIMGNLLMPGFTAPKLLWVQENEPETFKQIHKILLPKDYIRYCLTNDFATDLSDASGTAWIDVKNRKWSDRMIDATEIRAEQLPTLHEGSEITGTLKPELARAWSLNPHVTVIAGGGDNAASAISMGVTAPGSALLSLGTSGVYFIADQQYRPHPEIAVHTMCHCIPNLWHAMTVHLSAASCISWFMNTFKISKLKFNELMTRVETHNPQHTPIFLPYLSGERTPHNDPHARGVFFGLTHETQKENLVQAILEGVALSFAESQNALHHSGISAKSISVVGGGAKSLYWGKLLASALQKPLYYRKHAELGGAFGAARLAYFATQGGNIQQVLAPPDIDHMIQPDDAWALRFEQKLPLFREIYEKLRGSFQKLTGDTI